MHTVVVILLIALAAVLALAGVRKVLASTATKVENTVKADFGTVENTVQNTVKKL